MDVNVFGPTVGPLNVPSRVAADTEVKVTAPAPRHFNPGKNLTYRWFVNGQLKEGPGVANDSLVFTASGEPGQIYKVRLEVADNEINPLNTSKKNDKGIAEVGFTLVDPAAMGITVHKNQSLGAALFNLLPPSAMIWLKTMALICAAFVVLLVLTRLPEWLARYNK